ncbi:hypothetical protein HY768_07565 [candidate division TA06 bacterium]|uniref:Uncharacterized protein n=1 Tax=candidate division TA06 bacterium TaxID=2250710 RepID=A0A933IB85_UNCT6|nr:hypothetical protein [candidate division TA06 bacterium]
MSQDDISPAKLDEFNRIQDSLKNKKPQVRDFIELARSAKNAGLPKESKYNALKAGELDPQNPMVTAALYAELTAEEFKQWQEAHKKEIPFWRDLKSVLLYPAGKEGLLMLGLATLFFTAGKIVETIVILIPFLAILTVPLFAVGGILGIAILLVLPGFYTSITWTAALGKEGFPDWPGFGDIFTNLIGPALKALAVGLWSFMPLILALTATAQKKINPSVFLTVFTLLLGLLYFPMSFLMMAMSQKLWPSLLPSQVLDSMAKTGKHYWLLCLMFWLLLLPTLPAAFLWPVPVIGPLAVVFTGLYCWACSLYLLGKFYRYEKDKLKWF